MQSEVNEELTSVNLQQSSKGGGFDAKGEEKEKFWEAGGAEGGEGRGFRWVIYRDFKASNILLDKDFRAKLSDFGLAREGPTEGNTHVSTAVVGTHGYAAPDYIQTGHLTVKSDVWSFGVVLYEILTGRRTLDRNRPQGEQKLLEWVSQFSPDSRNFRMIMDPKLRGEYSVKAAREIAKLADSCLLKNAKERPTMSEVVEVLRRAEQAQAEPAGGDRARGAGKGKGVDVAAPSRS